MSTEQSGRTAVITGGGRGFGKAFGAALRRGARTLSSSTLTAARRKPPPLRSAAPAAPRAAWQATSPTRRG